MTKEFVKILIPWIIFFLLSDPGYVFIGTALALVSILLLVVPHLKKRLFLDWASFIFFILMGILVLFGGRYWLEEYGVLFGNSAFAFIAVLSLVLERPFSWEYATYSTKGYIYSPLLIKIHRAITGVWGLIFVLGALAHALYLDHIGSYMLMNEIVPPVLLIVGLAVSVGMPAYYKRTLNKNGLGGIEGISKLTYSDTSRGRVVYRTVGQGTPLVLLPDCHMTMHMWDPELIHDLKEDHKLILIDYPGIGDATFDGDYTVRGMADYVGAFLQEVVKAPVCLLGYGMGGWIAQQLALNYEQWLVRMVLVATDAGGPEAVPGHKDLVSSLILDPYSSQSYIDKVAPILCGSQPEKEEKAKLSQIAKIASLEPMLSEHILSQQRNLVQQWYQQGVYNKLKSISHLTLIIIPEKDQLIAVDNGRVLENNISNASVIRYEQSGHGVIYQEPYKMASHIKGFLAAVTVD